MEKFNVQGPEWPALQREVDALATSCGASLVFILDTGNILWAASGRAFARRHEFADAVYEAEVRPRALSLRRGASLEVTRSDRNPCYCARSFASTYVLALCFDGPFADVAVNVRVKRALPRIETLVLALPPLDGPGREAGALKVKA